MSRSIPYDRDTYLPPAHPGPGRSLPGDRRGPPKDVLESRRQKEKPSRTLFVHNIDYKITKEELHKEFEKFGAIRRVFPLIEKRGLAFVTFYDLRDANRAKQELQGATIGNRTVNIHYSLPKEDGAPPHDDDDPNSNYGSIFVLFRNVKSVSDSEVQQLFCKWGEVREVRDGKAKNYCIKFVDYWDTRHAEKAITEANGLTAFGGTIEARYANAKNEKKEVSSGNNYNAPDYRNFPPIRDDPYSCRGPPPPYEQYRDYGRYPPPPPPPSDYYSRDYPPVSHYENYPPPPPSYYPSSGSGGNCPPYAPSNYPLPPSSSAGVNTNANPSTAREVAQLISFFANLRSGNAGASGLPPPSGSGGGAGSSTGGVGGYSSNPPPTGSDSYSQRYP